ncbi:hypothetical protein JXA47_05235 [Candidatus Sumerlaeota bacterium]|nr:hypothetical protein [Candidatus Sumerlaeota bacterium]
MRKNTVQRFLSLITLGAALAMPSAAQFDSGSTGVDGPLDIQTNTVLPVQEDGVHHYTTINVANGATLSFSPNSLNTPVIFLASGDVTIDGTVNLNGQTGRLWNDPQGALPGSEAQPGPGGYPGGIGAGEVIGVHSFGTSGGGPGGGAAANELSLPPSGRGTSGNGGSHFTAGDQASGNPNGPAPTYGDSRLLTLSGGSGGGGGNFYVTSDSNGHGYGGGAGGGAILIASSGTITVNGTITAKGGDGHWYVLTNGGGTDGSGGGAGGAIRLMANSITGTGSLSATGGASVAAKGGDGLTRLEALSITGTIAANSNPTPMTSSPTVVQLDPADVPTVRITTINGIPVPEPPSGSTTSPDVVIPGTATNPIAIGLETANVPDGAVVNLRLILENGDTLEVASSAVSSDAATASVDLPSGVGVIYATVDFP